MSFLWTSVARAESSYLPVQASEVAEKYDLLYNFLTVTSLISFVILMGAMVFFIFKYKRKTENDETAYISGSHVLEFLWSFIPLVVFLGVFYWGWVVYKETRTFPEDANQVHVTGFQWGWTYQYDNGKKTTNDITVPVGKRTVLIMKSTDVLHSFFVPSFRIKQDVVPGFVSKVAFTPTKTGRYRLFCTEYCGKAHSSMIGWVNVVEPYEYEEFLVTDESAGMSLVQLGEKNYKNLCAACHSIDGSKVVGPSFKGLWGKKRDFSNAASVEVDENYLRESILNPNAKVVAGYQQGMMPMFQGVLTEDQITQVIEYIKTIK